MSQARTRPRVGVALLPELDWPADAERWRLAEDLGFDHAWVYDHLAWRALADGPWHATVPTLTAAALVTSRIRLGTFVATPNFRHPVTFAKEAMTLDVISEGRLSLALGAGADGYDARVLGQAVLSAGRRHGRFVEFVDLFDRLLRQPVTTTTGEWFTAHEARMLPGPRQLPRPPMIVAANGPRGIRLARRRAARPGDGWVTIGAVGGARADEAWWNRVAHAAQLMDVECEDDDAERPGFTRMLYLATRLDEPRAPEQLERDAQRAASLGFTDVVISWPRPSGPFAGDPRLLEAVGAWLRGSQPPSVAQ